MSRHVLPPPETLLGIAPNSMARSGSMPSTLNPNVQNPIASSGSSNGSPSARGNGSSSPRSGSAMHSSGKGGSGSMGVSPLRTLTPGVVGTVAYAAPEVLDEQLQAPQASVERVLKVIHA